MSYYTTAPTRYFMVSYFYYMDELALSIFRIRIFNNSHAEFVHQVETNEAELNLQCVHYIVTRSTDTKSIDNPQYKNNWLRTRLTFCGNVTKTSRHCVHILTKLSLLLRRMDAIDISTTEIDQRRSHGVLIEIRLMFSENANLARRCLNKARRGSSLWICITLSFL